MKIKNRVLASILSVAMLVSMIPSSAFAASYANVTSVTASSATATGSGAAGYESLTNSAGWGYKITVMVAELLTVENGEATYDWENAVPVGNTAYYKHDVGYYPDIYYNGSIFDMTTGNQTYTDYLQSPILGSVFDVVTLTEQASSASAEMAATNAAYYKEYKAILDNYDKTTSEYASVEYERLEDFLDRILDMDPDTSGNQVMDAENYKLPFQEDNIGGQEDGLSEYGGYKTESTEFLKSYFLNPVILETISDTTGGNWSVDDFVLGTYGDWEQCQFKIYVEPCLFRNCGSQGYTAMTWADATEEYRALNNGVPGTSGNKMFTALGAVMPYLGSMMVLAEDEPSLQVDGTYLQAPSGSLSYYTSGHLTKSDSIHVQGADATAGWGIGVFTGPSLTSSDYEPTPQIVKTYMIVESINADGSYVVSEQTIESTIENATFYTDEDNNTTNLPIYETTEGVVLMDTEGKIVEGTAYLNDSLTTPLTFTGSEEIVWTEGMFPTIDGTEYEASGKNIVTYSYDRILKTNGEISTEYIDYLTAILNVGLVDATDEEKEVYNEVLKRLEDGGYLDGNVITDLTTSQFVELLNDLVTSVETFGTGSDASEIYYFSDTTGAWVATDSFTLEPTQALSNYYYGLGVVNDGVVSRIDVNSLGLNAQPLTFDLEATKQLSLGTLQNNMYAIDGSEVYITVTDINGDIAAAVEKYGVDGLSASVEGTGTKFDTTSQYKYALWDLLSALVSFDLDKIDESLKWLGINSAYPELLDFIIIGWGSDDLDMILSGLEAYKDMQDAGAGDGVYVDLSVWIDFFESKYTEGGSEGTTLNTTNAVIDTTSNIIVPSNTLVLRYVVLPDASEINFVTIKQVDTDGNPVVDDIKYVFDNEKLPLDVDTVEVDKPDLSDIEDWMGIDLNEDDLELKGWVTNYEYPTIDVSEIGYVLPDMSEGGKEGDYTLITDYPIEDDDSATHNLYIEWE